MLDNGAIGFLKKKRDVIASVLLCLVALVIALILHPAYETNDDAYMEALLFGYQGMGSTSFLIFINRVLGCILHFLVSVFPHVSWYFLMHYTVCLASLFVLSLTFIRKFRYLGYFASLITLAAGLETLVSVQFTKTAALAAVAGILGLICSLREERRYFFKGLCIFLILMGSLIRFKALLMVSPFPGFAVLVELVSVFRNRRKELKRYVIAFGIALFLVLSFYAAGKIINSRTPGSDEYYRYNDGRSFLNDMPVDYSADPDSEVFMVANWMHNDPEVFTLEKMEQLGRDYHVEADYFSADILKTYFGKYIPRALIEEPLLIAALAGTLLFLVFSKRKLYTVPLLAFYVILEWILFGMGRAAFHRVDYGILFAYVTSLIYLSDVSIPKVGGDVKKLLRYGAVPLFAVISVVIICSYPLNWHIADREYFKGVGDSLAAATADSSYQYMVHPLAVGLDKQRNLYDLPYDVYNDGFFYMGGWQEGIAIPGLGYSNHCDIEGNPWEACVDSGTIRLVLPAESGDFCMKVISLYIKEHYGQKVKGSLEYQDDNVLVYRVVSV